MAEDCGLAGDIANQTDKTDNTPCYGTLGVHYVETLTRHRNVSDLLRDLNVLFSNEVVLQEVSDELTDLKHRIAPNLEGLLRQDRVNDVSSFRFRCCREASMSFVKQLDNMLLRIVLDTAIYDRSSNPDSLN